MTTLRVLIVEDSPTDEKLVLRELGRSHYQVQSRRVETAEDMREALGAVNWDVVLSDWSMPKFSALEALDVLRASGLEIPFIIVSGTVGEETAVEAMRRGANDYVLKDKLTRLCPAIERELADRETRSARRRAEEALRVSESRFSKLSDSGIIGIAVIDVHGNLYDGNNAYLDMVGYTREEVAAGVVKWSELTPPEWRHASEVAITEVLETGAARPIEKELIRKDGSRVPVLVGVAMMKYPMCISFYADLTDRRRAEESLRRTEEQLRHAQKMEAIGSLAGGVAHDFNNLLSVILSYASMLSEEAPKTGLLAEGLEEIRLAGERAAVLTGQLLAFSRRQMLHPRQVDLNEVVERTDNMLRRLIGEDIDLARATATALPPIFVDPGQMEQVIMNLAVNARDAMPDGGRLTIETGLITLEAEHVATHVGARPGPHVVLSVSDTGTGMDAETQARIFEPFFTTKDVGEGTGLGLSTVFGIVKQSGGSIWVYSEVGVGTTFRIYFPVSDDADVTDPPVAVPVATLDGSETILLVEDDTSLRTLACAILRRRGYHVLEASGGGDALLICEQHPGQIDLLLTDVVMPRMSGRQLAERLAPMRPDMRILYMSGYTANVILRHGLAHSNVGFIQKPVTPEGLARAVRQALDTPSQPHG